MDEEIIKWIADYCNGVISPEDFSRLRTWLQENQDNRRFFDQQLAFHHEVRTLYFLEQQDTQEAWEKLKGRLSGKRKFYSFVRKWSIAASLLIMLGGALAYWLNREKNTALYTYSDTVLPGSAQAVLMMANGEKVNLGPGYIQDLKEKDGTMLHTTKENILVYNPVQQPKEVIFHTIAVPVGGEYSLQLSDGSRVWLNSATTMRYPASFTGNQRDVYIEGEAFFDISKDAERPFIVHAGKVSVRVLGTEFNLSAYPEDSELITTLKTGKVEFEFGERKIELLPGRQVVLSREDSSVVLKNVDVSLYTAWVRGIFEFENLSLERIGVQLARWYGVEFVFTEPALAERYFTGGVKKYNTLRESLDLIENTTNVRFEIVEKKVFVTSR